MHDIRTIRDNPAAFDAALSRRGIAGLSSQILAIDEARRAMIHAAETAQADQNKASKEVGAAKGRGDEAEFERLRALVAEKKAEVAAMTEAAKGKDQELTDLLLTIPNLPYDDVPNGADEKDNVQIRTWGTPREMNFKPVEHYELKAVQGGMDFETAAKLSGSRFVILGGAVARLHRALAQFMIDTHVDHHGLTEMITPVLVLPEMMLGTGQLPKFAEEMFHTDNGYWLVPTAEVPLTNLVNDTVLDERELPLRFTAFTPCFRSEAGAAGKDTRGLIRLHQFPKVELVSITTPEQSAAEHDRMTACAEEVLKRLGLAFRTIVLCGGDMGPASRKTYDIEVWLPGQGAYREISSISDCGEFQGRRMNARWKVAGENTITKLMPSDCHSIRRKSRGDQRCHRQIQQGAPQIAAGKLRGLAISSDERLAGIDTVVHGEEAYAFGADRG